MTCELDIELWKFRDIYFDEGPHIYTDSLGTKYTSVTTFVQECGAELQWEKYSKRYVERTGKTIEEGLAEFKGSKFKLCEDQEWDERAERYALGHNVNGVQESIKAAKDGAERAGLVAQATAVVRANWKSSGDIACAMGTQVHSYMENLWKRKHYQPENPVGDYEQIRKNGLEAYNSLCRRFVPVRNEFIVYKPEWALCGTIDYLCWDRGNDCLAILDWKTNKEIKKVSFDHKTCVGPLNGLQDCNYVHYSAQLSTYKLILERMTNLRVGELALVHLKRDGWEYIPCMDLSVEIGAYLGNRVAEGAVK